jgi:hypothetical protein
MKRVLTTFALFGLISGVGCSGGPGSGGTVSDIGDITEAPPSNSDQAGWNPTSPVSAPTQAPPNSDAPPSNPFQPPVTSGGLLDCDALCGLLTCFGEEIDFSYQECRSECRAVSDALSSIPCAYEFVGLFNCFIRQASACMELTEDALLACFPAAERAIACVESTNFEDFEDYDIDWDELDWDDWDDWDDGPNPDRPSVPGSGTYQCPDGSGTISISDICDGYPDCDNGADEFGCD